MVVAATASATRTVKVDRPDPLGVPLMMPVDEARDRPVGSVPPVTVQALDGDVPPVAASVTAGYADPVVPDGNGLTVVIESAGVAVTVREYATAVPFTASESVGRTVML